jgi:hypothetical protein
VTAVASHRGGLVLRYISYFPSPIGGYLCFKSDDAVDRLASVVMEVLLKLNCILNVGYVVVSEWDRIARLYCGCVLIDTGHLER